MKQLSVLRAAVAVVAAAVVWASPQMVSSAALTFTGQTLHVSTENIKVENPKTGQTLSFVLVPKFDQVFSNDGKTTYTMAKIKPGDYVRVIYDTKALGIRHADKIYLVSP